MAYGRVLPVLYIIQAHTNSTGVTGNGKTYRLCMQVYALGPNAEKETARGNSTPTKYSQYYGAVA